MNSKRSLSLEFLIPTYRRLDQAVRAAQSIVDQQHLLPEGVALSVRIQDDASPGLSDDEFKLRTGVLPDNVVRKRNRNNLGMSGNILSLISSSRADFCTILTDDDYLQPNVLGEIAAELLGLLDDYGEFAAAALFVPRFSYPEDGGLAFVVCQPFEDDAIIPPSPVSVLRYADNGFILTGLFMKPEKLDYELWQQYRNNAFFCVIYFGSLLQTYPVAYRNRNWFYHTVRNLCYWDSWGVTDQQREARLLRDYLEAIYLLRKRSLESCQKKEIKEIHSLARLAYQRQLMAHLKYIGSQPMVALVPNNLFLQIDFILAFLFFYFRRNFWFIKARLRLAWRDPLHYPRRLVSALRRVILGMSEKDSKQ